VRGRSPSRQGLAGGQRSAREVSYSRAALDEPARAPEARTGELASSLGAGTCCADSRRRRTRFPSLFSSIAGVACFRRPMRHLPAQTIDDDRLVPTPGGNRRRTELMRSMKLDLRFSRKESGRDSPKIVRLLVGHPLIMKEMARHTPEAGSYAPVTILVDERS
jgi:hypothetical protein